LDPPERRSPPATRRRLTALTAVLLFLTVALPIVVRVVESVFGDRHRLVPSDLVGSGVSLALALWVYRLVRREQKANAQHLEELEHLSLTDPLTGLGNRRAFERDLPVTLKRAHRTGEPVTLLFIDVDHLKQLNDRYGHAAGDETLRVLGGVLRSSIRLGTDTAYRAGGDEFLMVLAGDRNAGNAVAARVSAAFQERSAHGSRISAGVVLWDGDASAAMLLREADTRMYRHKRPGESLEAAS
jgi:diguanylate cyclase (GGDEF)-like protein